MFCFLTVTYRREISLPCLSIFAHIWHILLSQEAYEHVVGLLWTSTGFFMCFSSSYFFGTHKALEPTSLLSAFWGVLCLVKLVGDIFEVHKQKQYVYQCYSCIVLCNAEEQLQTTLTISWRTCPRWPKKYMEKIAKMGTVNPLELKSWN